MSDAKILTTAEVEGMPHHTQQRGSFVIECSMHVLVRRDDLLATTRALETAQTERDGTPSWGVVRRLNDEWTEEAEKILARAENAERKRDEARATVAELVAALQCLERFAGKVGGREDLCEVARAALAKAKETKP
jgi:hypothetical protein